MKKSGKKLANKTARVTNAERTARADWHEKVVRGKACVVTGVRDYDWLASGQRARIEGHHVLSRSQLRAAARKQGRPEWELLWDPRGAIPVERQVHRRHTQAVQRISRGVLSAETVAFVEELGYGYVLERVYS